MDYDGDMALDAASEFEMCVFSGPTWSGFTKSAVPTTCSNDTLDDFGNLIETFRAGTVIDFGTLDFVVDWDPNSTTHGGKELGAFRSKLSGDWKIKIPANVGEDTGPIINIPGVVTMFKPQGTVRSTNEEARLAAGLTIKLSGSLSVTPAVATV